MRRAITRLTLLTVVLCTCAHAQPAKNVVLMVADGAGPTTWRAANQWQFGDLANTAPEFSQVYEQGGFAQHWMATYSGHNQPLPPGQTEARLGLPLPPGTLPDILPPLWNELPIPKFGSYDPAKANDTTPGDVRVWANDSGSLLGDRGPQVDLTPVESNPPFVQLLADQLEDANTVRAHLDQGPVAYDYLIWDSITDSASAGSALASGIRTYNSSINYTLDGQPAPFITEQMKALGKRAGVVTTKPFTDATPAVFGTQNDFRDDEAEISDAMIRNGLLDVIITPGHPEFGGGGASRGTPDYGTISSDNLEGLRDGTLGWTLVETVEELNDIGSGTLLAPERLFGLVPVSSSLNSRDTTGQTSAYDPRVHAPGEEPEGVVPFVMPGLETLTMAAINSLETDPDGFFLMVENASVDSAAHANNVPQMVEEMLAFNRAVDAVVNWIETESSWDETLLIITTDHANGLFLGPDSDTVPFQDPVAGAPGELPAGIFWTTNHTNELVPLWARGPGSERFALLGEGVDPTRGTYFHISDVHGVMSVAVVPLPAAWLFGASGMLAFGAFVRRPGRVTAT